MGFSSKMVASSFKIQFFRLIYCFIEFWNWETKKKVSFRLLAIKLSKFQYFGRFLNELWLLYFYIFSTLKFFSRFLAEKLKIFWMPPNGHNKFQLQEREFLEHAFGSAMTLSQSNNPPNITLWIKTQKLKASIHFANKSGIKNFVFQIYIFIYQNQIYVSQTLLGVSIIGLV